MLTTFAPPLSLSPACHRRFLCVAGVRVFRLSLHSFCRVPFSRARVWMWMWVFFCGQLNSIIFVFRMFFLWCNSLFLDIPPHAIFFICNLLNFVKFFSCFFFLLFFFVIILSNSKSTRNRKLSGNTRVGRLFLTLSWSANWREPWGSVSPARARKRRSENPGEFSGSPVWGGRRGWW